MDQSTQEPKHGALKRTVAAVAALNFGYFFVEFSIAVAIASVALFADSIDFLEDATINMLVLVALGWTAARRRAVGLLLAVCLLVPGLAALYTAWEKFNAPSIPDPTILTLAGLGALAVNGLCALLLSRVRHQGGSLSLAAFLSARNDVAANVAIIGAGLATAATGSMWPDVIVGIGIALVNSGSAYEVYEAAMGESDGDDDDDDRIRA
ncbi:MAG: cobalt transporter [Hyphomicrobium sp. 32-62-53]|nr:MAG: cobalt transporter [Hyphomicrobium sp. 12-62-95]OYX98778.1 MAG: cobalt transporter [Hyphomicrobium sp. 32-62-53]